MFPVTVNNHIVFQVQPYTTISDIKTRVTEIIHISENDFYLLNNGRILSDDSVYIENKIEVVFKVYGGKGGFGSMLRAIGAQIEKTTNREACRDLSGRRLRDINEEKRLKKWIEQQAEREKEAADRKQKKLKRLCEQPKFEFKDEEYDKMRSELPEIIDDSISQGMKAKIGDKRKIHNKDNSIKKKKKKLWLDDLEDLDTSSGDSETEDKMESTSSSDDMNSRDTNLCEASCSSSSSTELKECHCTS